MSATKATHTPGPWHLGMRQAERIIYNAAGWAVANATVYHGEQDADETKANALLIAAAPDLLHMLKEAVSHDNALKAEWKVPPRLLADMQKAIAKAEGGTL